MDAMKEAHNIIDMEEARQRLAFSGGTIPPLPWLWNLPRGSVFLTQDTDGYLSEWILLVKRQRSILLYNHLNEIYYKWVDPTFFCAHHSLFEELGVDNDCDTDGDARLSVLAPPESS
jgi:hypothetical protein